MNWSRRSNYDDLSKGFTFAGISAGLKDSSKKDLALILAPNNSVCSGVFTQSSVKASCIDICKQRLRETSGFIRAILVNSGHANACTGSQGRSDSILATKELSKLLGCNENEVLICSTGVIGVPIPMTNLIEALPNLVDRLDHNNLNDASEAILTTDLVQKKIVMETVIDGKNICIAGFAKGSGMIYPNMATMLAFLTCDAGIDKNSWDQIINNAVKVSFNTITVDGETSTNDTFLAINSGDKIHTKNLPIIQEGVNLVCQYLAKSIARDGEGANCLIEVLVQGTKNDSDAIKIAKKITNSSLVKTAIHGSDPNWGRIISAAGNAGIIFDLQKVDLLIGEFVILEKGRLQNFKKQKVVSYLKSKMNSTYLQDDIVEIKLHFNDGNGYAKSWGCDFSKQYIEINSEYTT